MTTILAFIFWIASLQLAATQAGPQTPRLPTQATIEGPAVRSDVASGESAAPRASISGSVVDVGTTYLQPLFDARVELIRPSGSPVVVRSDAYGRFVFPDLQSGRYRVSVTRDGYQRKTASIELGPGQQRADLLLALDLAPTLFGHVRDPNNIPISNVLVEAVKVVYGPRGDRSVESVESALTDDLGEYHLYWLDPGEYYILASPLVLKPDTTIPGNPPSDSVGPTYAPTYYPGFRDPKDASMIRLRVGSNLSAFDFKIQPATLVEIWGHLYVEATGESVGGASITATPAGAVASVQSYETKSASSPDNIGEFRLFRMMPGTYVISSQYPDPGRQLILHRKFTLKGSERVFIIKLSPGVVVNGTIRAASGSALDFRSVHVILESVDPDLPSPANESVDANGQFGITRVEPGEYSIRVTGLPADVYLKSAHANDVDVLSKPVLIAYAPPEPIRMVLGVDGGKLDGSVLDTANRPFAGAVVVLIPDAARRNSPTQYRATASEADGHFTLRGIPPGDYKLFAWQNIEPNAYLNDIYLSGYERFGVPMTIEPNAIGTTSIRLIPMD